MSQYTAPGTIVKRATISAAAYLRVKPDTGSNDLGIALAGDEACIGTLAHETFGDSAPVTIYANGDGGSKLYVANGAIAIGAAVSSVAGGKIQTGTGGAVDLGFAASAAGADGDIIEVNPPE